VFPQLTKAQVYSVDPNKRLLYVLLPSSQGLGIPVEMGYEGPADALRLRQTPMPTKGTWGLVAFPHGDSRNGVWLRSIYTSKENAVLPGDANADYDSHWSGAWSLMTGDGQVYKSFPDGTFITLADETTLPALTRNTVDQTQTQQAVPYPQTDRLASAPPARPLHVHHSSGTDLLVDKTGNTTITIAAGASVSVSCGGTTVTISPQGGITVVLASGQSTQFTNGGAASDMLTKATELVALFNAHTHADNGSGVPNQQITAAEIGSALVKVTS